MKALRELEKKLQHLSFRNKKIEVAVFDSWRTKDKETFLSEYRKENNLEPDHPVFLIYLVNDREDVADLNKLTNKEGN